MVRNPRSSFVRPSAKRLVEAGLLSGVIFWSFPTLERQSILAGRSGVGNYLVFGIFSYVPLRQATSPT